MVKPAYYVPVIPRRILPPACFSDFPAIVLQVSCAFRAISGCLPLYELPTPPYVQTEFLRCKIFFFIKQGQQTITKGWGVATTANTENTLDNRSQLAENTLAKPTTKKPENLAAGA